MQNMLSFDEINAKIWDVKAEVFYHVLHQD